MNTVMKIFLSMSCSGSLLILVLLLGKRFLKDRISRQWQYYIWLAVILRLLLPFGPEVNLLENLSGCWSGNHPDRFSTAAAARARHSGSCACSSCRSGAEP